MELSFTRLSGSFGVLNSLFDMALAPDDASLAAGSCSPHVPSPELEGASNFGHWHPVALKLVVPQAIVQSMQASSLLCVDPGAAHSSCAYLQVALSSCTLTSESSLGGHDCESQCDRRQCTGCCNDVIDDAGHAAVERWGTGTSSIVQTLLLGNSNFTSIAAAGAEEVGRAHGSVCSDSESETAHD